VSGLGVARNLGRAGIVVHRLGATHEQLLQSRYIRTTRVVLDLDQLNDEEYLAVLEDVRREIGGRPVLFPITDLHVLRHARLGPERLEGFHSTAPASDIAELLVNKGRFYEKLEALGIPHPRTRHPQTLAEFEAAAAEIGYPVYVKPEISPQFHHAFHRKGFVARNQEELRSTVHDVTRSGLRVVLQEIVPGDARCMYGVAGYRRADGEAAWVCYRRVREYPAGFGCGSVIETCESFVHETRLLELLETIGYEGLFDAELKRDRRSGAFSLIEINARSWWQNLLPTLSGINLIELRYRDATGQGAEAALPRSEYELGVKWVHLYNDISAARNEGLGWLAWIRSLMGRKVFAFHALDDPLPHLRQLAWIFRGKIRALAGRYASVSPEPAEIQSVEPSLAVLPASTPALSAPPVPESPQQA